MAPDNVPPHSRHLIGHSEFLHGSKVCLPFNILEKLTHHLHLFQYDTTSTHSEEQYLPFQQTGTTTSFWLGYQSCTWKRSGLFFPRKHVLVVTVRLIWFFFMNIFSLNFVTTPNKSLRFRKLRKSYIHRSFVVYTNHFKLTLLFLLDVRCSKWPHSCFLWLLVPNDGAFV